MVTHCLNAAAFDLLRSSRPARPAHLDRCGRLKEGSYRGDAAKRDYSALRCTLRKDRCPQSYPVLQCGRPFVCDEFLCCVVYECLLRGKVLALSCIHILDLLFRVHPLFLLSFCLCFPVHNLVPGLHHDETMFPKIIKYIQDSWVARGGLIGICKAARRCWGS